MNWAIGFIIVLGLVVPMGIGLGLGAYRAVQSPAFVGEAGALIVKALFPIIKEIIARPNSPEIEAKMHEVIRRGGQWDNFRKRERK